MNRRKLPEETFRGLTRVLAIDAMQAGGSAGTLYSLRVSEVEDRGLRASPTS